MLTQILDAFQPTLTMYEGYWSRAAGPAAVHGWPACYTSPDLPTTGIRPEDKLIDLFLTVYDDCSWAGSLSDKDRPERVVDGGVEMLAKRFSDGRRPAIEHTLIEPFVGEKTDFHSYQELAVRLQADPSLQVPGLAITVEAPVNVLPARADRDGIIADVSAWIRAEGPSWPQEKALRECPCPHHPNGTVTFQVQTTPLGDPNVKFVNVHRYGELRVWESVEKALRGTPGTRKPGKPTKLARTNADTRLLILERQCVYDTVLIANDLVYPV